MTKHLERDLDNLQRDILVLAASVEEAIHKAIRALHEPLDTDTTPKLEGEYWLMHNGYTQAEGVANLDKVPEIGCLVVIGYPKFAGGLGGYARYIAICPADWKYGVSVGAVPEAPLPKSDKILQWDAKQGMRVRK